MRPFATVVFDCDSTLSTIEGIEELAGPAHAEVVRLTEAAMRGEVPLESVYGRRLELIRPSRQAVEAIGRRYVETLVPDAAAVVRALVREGVRVEIVSGGLRPAVLHVAAALGISAESVAAVDVAFDGAGAYAGFDEASPLARAGGKRALLASVGADWPRPRMLVGDGATDLEARPEVDCFVAFAGVVERPAVVAAADRVVRALTLTPILALALDGRHAQNPESRALVEAGRRLLAAPSDPPIPRGN